jgi:starch synthase
MAEDTPKNSDDQKAGQKEAQKETQKEAKKRGSKKPPSPANIDNGSATTPTGESAKPTRRKRVATADTSRPRSPVAATRRAPQRPIDDVQGRREPVEGLAASRELSVLMVTPEAHPYAKTGGLAEVTAALSDALTRLGHAVTLVVPQYRGVAVAGANRLQTRIRLGDRVQPVAYTETQVSPLLTVVLVDVPELFDRPGLYGTADGDYPDNPWRFGVFSRAALEYARLKEWRPSVIHAHDWQTGLVPVYQKMHLSSDPFVGGVPAVFTLHNLAFQGIFPPVTLPALGLGYEVMDVQGMEFWGNISFLKGGINFSEKITTVSPGYAREIVHPELGFGFEGVLARRSDDLVGILNGIDTARWSPSGDPFGTAAFSVDDLSGKRDAKRALLTDLKLAANERAMSRPVIGLISRLTEQKGFDLLGTASAQLMALDATWTMLGNGERRFEDALRTLAARYSDRVSATIGFDERLAHLIEAGADMFLMPSRFEPCGLNQLYSLRYGTVPIVRSTGGLNDTVVDADELPGKGTGFKFRDYTPQALVEAVVRAGRAFQDTGRWQDIQKRGMRQDHSWDVSATEYVKLYVGM